MRGYQGRRLLKHLQKREETDSVLSKQTLGHYKAKKELQRVNRILTLQMYRFSLAIYFMDVQPSLAFPLLHDFWI